MNDYAPPPVSRYAPYPVNKDKIAETVHALQVDLSMLAGWLAATPAPEMTHASLESLEYLRHFLVRFAPGMTRH
jgi:hypothetical protein